MKHFLVWLAAIGIGIIDAVLLSLFEFVGVEVTAWLWNDLLHTDVYRWLVIPVAIVLGLGLTLVIKLLKDKRVVPVEADILDEMKNAPVKLSEIGTILAIGATSLLAGASLGPEAALMAASAGIGAFVAVRLKLNSAKQALVLASVGALLVAFVGSPLLVLVPLLILFQGVKKQKTPIKGILKPSAIIIVAGLTSFLTNDVINFLTGKAGGYGTVPTLPHFAAHDFAMALILGFVAGGIAAYLTWLMKRYNEAAIWLYARHIPAKDWLIGGIFSAILGILYFIGGQTVQFSGNIGSHLLIQNAAQFSLSALVLLLVSKLLATAWSKGTGYRGGLVFPSIYMGIALGLIVGQLFPGLGGLGAILGAVAGMLTAVVGSPIMAGIFLIAFLPPKVEMWAVAICAITGTICFSLVSKRIRDGSNRTARS